MRLFFKECSLLQGIKRLKKPWNFHGNPKNEFGLATAFRQPPFVMGSQRFEAWLHQVRIVHLDCLHVIKLRLANENSNSFWRMNRINYRISFLHLFEIVIYVSFLHILILTVLQFLPDSSLQIFSGFSMRLIRRHHRMFRDQARIPPKKSCQNPQNGWGIAKRSKSAALLIKKQQHRIYPINFITFIDTNDQNGPWMVWHFLTHLVSDIPSSMCFCQIGRDFTVYQIQMHPLAATVKSTLRSRWLWYFVNLCLTLSVSFCEAMYYVFFLPLSPGNKNPWCFFCVPPNRACAAPFGCWQFGSAVSGRFRLGSRYFRAWEGEGKEGLKTSKPPQQIIEANVDCHRFEDFSHLWVERYYGIHVVTWIQPEVYTCVKKGL